MTRAIKRLITLWKCKFIFTKLATNRIISLPNSTFRAKSWIWNEKGNFRSSELQSNFEVSLSKWTVIVTRRLFESSHLLGISRNPVHLCTKPFPTWRFKTKFSNSPMALKSFSSFHLSLNLLCIKERERTRKASLPSPAATIIKFLSFLPYFSLCWNFHRLRFSLLLSLLMSTLFWLSLN